MKYNIVLLISVFLITSNILQGQSYCPPNGIITNPDEPINTHNPNLENTFFDWRLDVPDFTNYFYPDYVISPPYFPHHYSPYWGNFNYLGFVTGFSGGAEVVDFSPIEGWELITRNFGLFKDDTKNTGFYCPYFLMYNKYQGKFRIFFAVPSVDATGASAIEVELKFNNKELNDDNTAPVTGLFGHNGKTSQPLDIETTVTTVKGIAKYNPSGWNFTDIVAAYDPCTCNGETSIQVDFNKVTTGTITLTGGFIGTEEVLKSSSKLLTDNMLFGIANNGTSEAVGVETYSSIAKSVASYNEGDGGISTSVEILSQFSGAFAYVYPQLANFYPKTNLSAADGAKAKKQYKEDLGFISRTIKYGTSLLKSAEEKKTLPTIIQGEIALTGSYNENILNPTGTFVFDNPGTAFSNNNRETGVSSHPAYPLYNEVLGRFAVLETPKIKSAITLNQYGTNTQSVYEKTQFELESLEYVYNPAVGVNEAKTTILAAIMYESSTNTHAKDDGHVEIIPNDYDAFEEGVFLNQSYLDPSKANINKEIFKTPWMPLECLSNYTVNFMTDTVGLNSDLIPFDYNRPATPYLQLMIFYEFNELDRNGEPNRDIQVLTYPLERVGVTDNDLNSSLPFEKTIPATNFNRRETIEAIGRITITGDLTTSLAHRPGSPREVTIIAPEIIVADGVEIGKGINLISSIPNICGEKKEKSTINLTDFCQNGSYKGNQRKKLPIIEPEIEIEDENHYSMLAYPNPFESFTTISFELEELEKVSLNIYDALGGLVESIIDGENLPKGNYKRVTRKKLSAGLYFAVLRTKNGTQTIKIVKQ